MAGEEVDKSPEVSSRLGSSSASEASRSVFLTDSDIALAQLLASERNRPLDIAGAYAFRGQPDEALEWLDRACAQKDAFLYGIKGDLRLSKLEGNPRFKAFLEKMNLPE